MRPVLSVAAYFKRYCLNKCRDSRGDKKATFRYLMPDMLGRLCEEQSTQNINKQCHR